MGAVEGMIVKKERDRKGVWNSEGKRYWERKKREDRHIDKEKVDCMPSSSLSQTKENEQTEKTRKTPSTAGEEREDFIVCLIHREEVLWH